MMDILKALESFNKDKVAPIGGAIGDVGSSLFDIGTLGFGDGILGSLSSGKNGVWGGIGDTVGAVSGIMDMRNYGKRMDLLKQQMSDARVTGNRNVGNQAQIINNQINSGYDTALNTGGAENTLARYGTRENYMSERQVDGSPLFKTTG